MSAYEVTEEAVKRIDSGKYDVMILNFANPDMVGHTGVMEAAVKAVHTVDECAAKVVDAVLRNGGTARCWSPPTTATAEQNARSRRPALRPSPRTLPIRCR